MNKTKVFSMVLAAALLISPSLPGAAAELPEPDGNAKEQISEGEAPASLAELASAADVIAVVQMRDGDYRYQREFPVSGSAYLKVLIAYKVDQPLDLIEVYEKGLHENECYFPNPTVFEEGRRYLVFLRRDPDDAERYRGLPQGCALDVLVTADNTYAVRLPITGVQLSDPLLDLAQPLNFADPYARETDETVDSQSRDRWLAEGLLRREQNAEGDELVYTQGVSLGDVRPLLGLDNLPRHPHQKPFPGPDDGG
jgi:hypothetical protein